MGTEVAKHLASFVDGKPQALRVRRAPEFVVLLALITAVYILLAKLGLALAFVNPSATAVWPPTGLSIAVCLIFGYRVWPALLVGAFVANITTAGSATTSLVISVGNTLEGLAGAWLVNRFADGRLAFRTPAGVFKFALLAGALAPLISATVGVTSLSIGGYANWPHYGAIWSTWWLGDVGGALIVAPLLLLWSERPLGWPASRRIELCLFFVFVAAVGQIVFDSFGLGLARNYPLDFLCIPVLVWAAFRLGFRATATGSFLLSAIAVWGTWHGSGPFARANPNESLLLLQVFMGVLAVTSVAVAAAVQERDRAEAERDRLLEAEQEARARAEAATSARDDFLSTASHELKTPVTTLKGWAQLLLLRQTKGDLDGERLRRALMLIDETTNRLASLINDLLDVSRIQTGHLTLSCQQVDLAELVVSAVDRAREQYGESHSFSVELLPDAGLARADANRLDQVLTNLLENAVKYSRLGGKVTIGLKAVVDDGLLLSVRDAGIGLPPGAEATIFEPFARASNADTSHASGTGLGLYICRNIVQLHGGRIWAQSNGVGQGTAVFVWLPRAAAAEVAASA